ncbi:MAG: hypothetical protein M3Q79_04335 [bacterium]|nr:hypothetical protein [bacterium]
MFKQLVTNLPFNPSLIHEVTFYVGRLRKETSVRRIGFIFMALAMIIQMVAVISPPEKSMAASDNHIINGLTTRDGILQAWDAPGSDIPAIYGHFGVTRADIAKLPQYPNTTIRSNDGNDWWTTGRNSLTAYSNVSDVYKNSELALKVSDQTTIFMRQLRAWDIRNPYNTYSAWTGTKADGTKFWVLKDCGNYTQVGKLPPKTPKLEIRKTIVGSPSSLKPGDTMKYRLEWRNSALDSLAENVFIEDALDIRNFDVVSPTNLPINAGLLRYPVGNLPYSDTYKVLEITVRLKNPLATGTNICNVSRITATNAPAVSTNPVCVSVLTPCIYDATQPNNSPECVEPKLICKLVTSVLKQGTREVTLTTTVESTNKAATTVKSYTYDFGDKSNVQVVNSAEYKNSVVHTYPTGDFTAKTTVQYTVNKTSGSTAAQIECSSPVSFEEEKPVGETKTVKNVTQNLEGDAAIKSTVKPGDVIEYKLTTTNSQAYDKKDYMASDYVGDILDYAELDMESLAAEKAVFNKDFKKIEWPKENIVAGGETVHVFRVKIKDPIPSTNAPSTVSTNYDCKISNKFGNEITMGVSCPVVKGIETLPNTGPGASLVAGFAITSVVGYFFARSKLLAKELDLLKHDYVIAGV